MVYRGSALVLSVLVASVLVSGSPDPAPCAQYMTCQLCVSHHLCGWCSEPVVYPDNRTGAQCAGFSPNGTHPFACNGIYSTDKCVSGYVCDMATFTCQLGKRGTGTTLQKCEENCTNHGQVYLCNRTTEKCYQVPSGTPGAASYSVCMAACTNPSPHPASPHPAPPPAKTYLCNYSTGNCDPAKPGHGSSLNVCEENCKKSNGTKYLCNSFLKKCVVLPPDVPGGESLQECELQCNPKPNPGPPIQFKGLWRGIEIQNNLKIGEWDIKIDGSDVTMVDIVTMSVTKGIPYTQGTELWIKVTSGRGVGKYIKAIGESAHRGPETDFLTAAFGTPGGPAPASLTTAMTDGSSTVFFLSKCAGTPECIFTMPLSQNLPLGEVSAAGPHREGGSVSVREEVTVDPCSQYSQSCEQCLSHQYCGWCSTNVTYNGGKMGTQCAGFSQNENNSNPFVCSGRYSTFNCTQGYDCDLDTLTCVPDPTPGNGASLKACEALCKPTPPPTPPPKQWVCNISTKTCYKCNETYCPGSMPEETCAAACVKPKPGPTGLVVGEWRGLQIQNHYPMNEFEWVFNSSAVTVYFMDKEQWSGTVVSYGGDVMILDVTSGKNAGKKLSAIYSVQNQGGPIYSIMTLAVGVANGPLPQNYAGPMRTPGSEEYVLAKCAGSPCKFPKP